MTDEAVELLVGVMALAIGLPIYFMPALVASGRRHRQRVAILVLNLLLGWTVLGWVGALVWAFTADTNAVGRALGQSDREQ